MPTRPFLISAAFILALTAACDDGAVRINSTRSETTDAKGALKVVDTLQCPQSLGDLTRKGSASQEGTVCAYSGPRGAEVSLHLVKLGEDTPDQVLKMFETRLSRALPRAVDQLKADAKAENPQGVTVETNGDQADISLPGGRIEAKGDQASIRIGGFQLDARDGDAQVKVQGADGKEAVSVQANDDAAEVRTRSDGEATRAHWVLTDNRPAADGWRLVGYEARGPVGGPLVVATVRSRDRDHDGAFDNARELVTLNVGE